MREREEKKKKTPNPAPTPTTASARHSPCLFPAAFLMTPVLGHKHYIFILLSEKGTVTLTGRKYLSTYVGLYSFITVSQLLALKEKKKPA